MINHIYGLYLDFYASQLQTSQKTGRSSGLQLRCLSE